MLKKEGRKTWVNDIALSLGKRPEYVQQMADTWGKMGAGARKALQEGKVGMSLAVLISQRTASDKLASLSVEIAAAAKENLKAGAVKVSDAVIAEAVTMTTDKVVKDSQKGIPVSGAVIGAEILANIQRVKDAQKVASIASKAAKTQSLNGQTLSLGDFMRNLASETGGKTGELIVKILSLHQSGASIDEAKKQLTNNN